MSTCSESPRSGRSWQLRRSCPAPRSRYPNTEAGEVVAASLGGCSDKAVAVAACDRRRDDPAGQLPEKPLDLGDGNYSSCPLGDLRDLDHATVGGASENEGSICLILTTSMLCYRKIIDGSQ